MIKGDPSRLEGRKLFIVDSESELDIALSEYDIENQDGFLVMDNDVIIVKRYGSFEKSAYNYLKGLG